MKYGGSTFKRRWRMSPIFSICPALGQFSRKELKWRVARDIRGRRMGDTERFIETLSRERRCSVTKDETCNNRGICSFSSSCSFTQRLPTVGLVTSARAPWKSSLPPSLLLQLVRPHHPLQSPFPPRRRRRWCRCRLVLEFRSCSCGIPPRRTNLNKRPPVVPRRRITWSFKSSVTITVSLRQAGATSRRRARDPVSRFHRKSLAPRWPRLCLLSKRTPIRISRNTACKRVSDTTC